jgi:hypothetical protein
MVSWLYASSILASLIALPALSMQFWLYKKLKDEVRRVAVHMATTEDVTNTVSPVSDQVSGLQLRLDQLENNKREQDEWIAEAESINLNRRGQVLRLHRRGESIPEIASALRVGLGEVRLIIKVYELSKNEQKSDESGLTPSF